VANPDEPTLAQRVRLRVYEHFVEHGSPPVLEQLMSEFGTSRAEMAEVLEQLASIRHLALLKGTSRILMAWPFSAVATPFVSHTAQRHFFANCAWDAIAIHALLGTDVRVESFCHHCARPITIDLAGGRAVRSDPDSAIVYFALKPTEWWEDIVTTCSNTMVFFCSTEHRDASDLAAPADRAATLTPDQTLALSGPLYSRRLSLDFERPNADELRALFASLNLTTPYWTS
jgi:hypothetical protein